MFHRACLKHAMPAAALPWQSRAQGELGMLRQRCALLAGQLQEAQRTVGQLQVRSGWPGRMLVEVTQAARCLHHNVCPPQ